jgi:hypothetical protein
MIRTLLLAVPLLALNACTPLFWEPEACGPLYGIARIGPIGDAYQSGRQVQNIDGFVHTTFGQQELYPIDRGTLHNMTRNGDIVSFRVDRGAMDKYANWNWGPRAYYVERCKLPRSAARRILSRSEYERYEREGRFD